MAGFGGDKPASGKAKAGFGSKGKVPKKKELVSPKRQWDAYTRLTEAGATAVKVFARDGAVEGDEWLLVGQLAIDAAEGSAAQAAQYQKRLILEHAARMSPRLKVAQARLGDSNPNPNLSPSANPSPHPNPGPKPESGEPRRGYRARRRDRQARQARRHARDTCLRLPRCLRSPGARPRARRPPAHRPPARPPPVFPPSCR